MAAAVSIGLCMTSCKDSAPQPPPAQATSPEPPARADVNTRGEDGSTALMQAAKGRQVDLVKNLIAAGANVNAKDNLGRTALMYAASNGDLESVRALIAAHADVNLKDNDGSTALTFASTIGDAMIRNALIHAHADVSAEVASAQTQPQQPTEGTA